MACSKEQPTPVDDASLGIALTFPGPPARSHHEDPNTPFGPMSFFDHRYLPPGRMDESFHVEVGNLPAGSKGGTTTAAVLETFEGWLKYRFQRLEKVPLPPDRGPGFTYRTAGPNGRTIAGVVIVKRARIHHAQATVRQAGDPRLEPFLQSFRVK